MGKLDFQTTWLAWRAESGGRTQTEVGQSMGVRPSDQYKDRNWKQIVKHLLCKTKHYFCAQSRSTSIPFWTFTPRGHASTACQSLFTSPFTLPVLKPPTTPSLASLSTVIRIPASERKEKQSKVISPVFPPLTKICACHLHVLNNEPLQPRQDSIFPSTLNHESLNAIWI